MRAECRAWLREHLPWEYGVGPAAPVRRPRRGGGVPPRLAGRAGRGRLGRASPGPPSTAAGAPARSHHYVVQEELARARAPELVGPHRHQPGRPHPAGPRHRRAEGPLAAAASSRADELFCQLFSEPDAGSDLASLSHPGRRAPTATAAGGSTGQKVWTSYAQFADWGLCLARTDPDVQEAGRHHRVRGRHARPRRRGPAAAADHRRVRLQRGVLRRRVRPRRLPGRRRSTTAGGCRSRRSPTSAAPTPASW